MVNHQPKNVFPASPFPPLRTRGPPVEGSTTNSSACVFDGLTTGSRGRSYLQLGAKATRQTVMHSGSVGETFRFRPMRPR